FLFQHRAIISRDGRHVVFNNNAFDVIPGVIYPFFISQTYVLDVQTDVLTLLSHAGGDPNLAGNGESEPVAMSGDGRYVLFATRATDVDISVIDSDFEWDLVLYDLTLGSRKLITVTSDGSRTLQGIITRAMLSEDGLRVLFSTDAADVVVGQGEGAFDVFLYEHVLGRNRLLSSELGSSTQPANGSSFADAWSADGRHVLINSEATNLVSGVDDNNDNYDVFAMDIDTGQRRILSAAPGTPNTTGNALTLGVAVSRDGSKAFLRDEFEQYLIELPSLERTPLPDQRINILVTPDTVGKVTSAFSDDGRYLLFYADSANPPTDANEMGVDTFVYDHALKVTRLVSGSLVNEGRTGNGASAPAQLSPDGQTILLQSDANDLATAVDANDSTDVFVAQFVEAVFADDFD
ncbi:MAG: hypothetical protein KDI51_16545, partial [Xanthomonadales bacterium]|nr:hypothetical protein [Xanthomonadales bacterium]